MGTTHDMAEWVKAYDLMQQGKKDEAFFLARDLLDGVIKSIKKRAYELVPYRSHDLEDLEQSLLTIILMELPKYCPYQGDVLVNGRTYFHTRFQGALSNFVRGGDGLGAAEVSKHYINQCKKNGTPVPRKCPFVTEQVNFSEEDVSGLGEIYNEIQEKTASISPEDMFFNEYIPEELLVIYERLKDLPPAERSRVSKLYRGLAGLL